MIRETNEQRFGTDIFAPGITIVDFWAPSSGASGVQAPILKQFSVQRPDVRVLTVDAEQNPRLASSFKVEKLPAMMVFKDGHPLIACTGVQHTYALERLVRAAEQRADRIAQA
jgi:thioredoxin 1